MWRKRAFWLASALALALALSAGAVYLVVFVLLNPVAAIRCYSPSTIPCYKGSLDGAPFLIEVPRPWNGTLVLYSHGSTTPGASNVVATDAMDPTIAGWLLHRGYALAGSAYATTGFIVPDGLRDQIALLNYFTRTIGRPTQVIAWGRSLGGEIAAGLVQENPGRFSGAITLCGVMAGSIAFLNSWLDAQFAFRVLLADGSSVSLVRIQDPEANADSVRRLFDAAMASPQGRARLSLVAALADLPGWEDPRQPEPAPSDVSARFHARMNYLALDLTFWMGIGRADVEKRGGGNPSWNVGVDYLSIFARSADQADTRLLYSSAGLSLDADLERVNAAPRVSADPRAVAFWRENIDLRGRLDVPVLTLHTVSDPVSMVENESAYREAVRSAGNSSLLAQAYVRRAGHCSFTDAETIAAFEAEVSRIQSGSWAAAQPQALENAARGLGSGLSWWEDRGLFERTGHASPAFVSFDPGPFPRP